MKRPVALLDIDDTLLFKDSNRINLTLLKALKNKNIVDIYLISDMAFTNSVMRQRIALIRILEKKGFVVHELITPSDLSWDILPAEETARVHQVFFRPDESIKLDYFFYKDALDEQKHATLVDSMSHYAPKKHSLGRSYAEALSEYQVAHNSLSLCTQHRSFFTRTIACIMGKKKGYDHVKGLLLDLFLRYPPLWVSSIVFVDDNADVIKTISHFYPTDNKLTIPLITMIPIIDKSGIKKNNLPLAYYEEKLNYHLAIEELNQFIKQLQSGCNPFKRSALFKIEALEDLKTEMLSDDQSTHLASIIDKWSYSIRTLSHQPENEQSTTSIIAIHRNKFLPTNRPGVETNTQKFLKHLKEKYAIQNDFEETASASQNLVPFNGFTTS